MISEVFQEIRERSTYVSEVRKYVFEVLKDFQADAQQQGVRIIVAEGIADVTGESLDLSERGKEESSTISLEINSTGNVLLWRRHTRGLKSEIDEPEHRLIDMSKPAVSTAAEILLAMAGDHRGFVGSTLENYLQSATSDQAPSHTSTFTPPTHSR